MSNMGYCRFRNTLEALKDCYEYLEDIMEDPQASCEEIAARNELVLLCEKIAEELKDTKD